MRNIRRHRNSVGRPAARLGRGGFTLVEMLVSVGLVLLMMLMFAEIFTIASGSISLQRGIAQDDQKVRSVTTVLRGDLDKRSFRRLSPFLQGETSSIVTSDRHFNQRRGYFYISENDPNNDTDDVLQFTTDANIITKATDTTRYFGRAALLTPSGNVSAFFRNANQPVADDGQIDPNDGTASSSMAEISYFLRNGNLYRRVLLIREPLDIADAEPQPKTGTYGPYDSNVDFFDPSPSGSNPPPLYSGNFWGDFDFSAYYFQPAGKPTPWAHFHGSSSLDNGSPSGARQELGNPRRRFGHNHVNGFPREYITAGFFGRFTHEETSNTSFGYPHNFSSNPMASGTSLTFTSSGSISEYAGGARRAQDLLLANVISFDIEVWDVRLGGFVDIGHSNSNGQFYSGRNRNSSYGSGGSFNNVFDTWHPALDVDVTNYGVGSESLLTQGAFDPSSNYAAYDAPYIPMVFPCDAAAPNANAWQPGTIYNAGDMVVPTLSSFASATDSGNHHPEKLVGDRAYVCIVGGTSHTIEPTWPATPGSPVTESTGVQWETMDNLSPLKAIRITLQFRDPATPRVRQMTLIHGLLD